METKNKYWYVLLIAGVVVFAWWLTRRKPIVTMVEQPNTAGAGLPTYSPQTQQYNVGLPKLAPSPGLQRLPASNRPNINFDASRGPINLVYNFPTYNEYAGRIDKSRHLAVALQNKYEGEQRAKMLACGCGGGGCSGSCGGCEQSCPIQGGGFPDGTFTCMSANPNFGNPVMNPKSLLMNPAVFLPWLDNLNSASEYESQGPIRSGGRDPGLSDTNRIGNREEIDSQSGLITHSDPITQDSMYSRPIQDSSILTNNNNPFYDYVGRR